MEDQVIIISLSHIEILDIKKMDNIIKKLLELNGISVDSNNRISYGSYNLVFKKKPVRSEFIIPNLTDVDEAYTVLCSNKTKCISKTMIYLSTPNDELKNVIEKVDEKLRQRKSREYVPKIKENVVNVFPNYCWKGGWAQFVVLGYKYDDRRINFIGCIVNEKEFYYRKENLYGKNDVELEDWIGPMSEKKFEEELDCFNDLIELHKLEEG